MKQNGRGLTYSLNLVVHVDLSTVTNHFLPIKKLCIKLPKYQDVAIIQKGHLNNIGLNTCIWTAASLICENPHTECMK